MNTPGQFLKLRGNGEPARTQDNVSATLTPIANALNATPIMGAPPPRWVRPDILSNGYTQTAAPQPQVAFHVDALGYVHTKMGLTHAAGCIGGTVAFTYPLALWPTETLTFNVCDANGINSSVQISVIGELSNLSALAPGDEVRGYFLYRPGT